MTNKELLKQISSKFNTYDKNFLYTKDDVLKFELGKRMVLEKRKNPNNTELLNCKIFQTYNTDGNLPTAITVGSDTLVFSDGFTRYGIEEKLWPFFSTISLNLEPNGWGTRYPVLLKCLCDKGVVEYRQLKILLAELVNIKKKFTKLKIKDIYLDFDNPKAKPTCKDEKEYEEPLLKFFYFTNKEENILFSLIFAAIGALNIDADLTIERY